MGVSEIKWTPEFMKAALEISNAGTDPKRLAQTDDPGFFFAHYTSAGTIEKIMDKGVFYLRNSRLMNDRSEVWRGFEATLNAFAETEGGKRFIEAWESIHPGLGEHIADEVQSTANTVIPNCYIFSVCEHRHPEDDDGLLSMWRAYGSGDLRVAVVAKPRPFSTIAREGVLLMPVLYGGIADVGIALGRQAEAIKVHRDILKQGEAGAIKSVAAWAAIVVALSLKHPGFSEEREWRFIFMSNLTSAVMQQRRDVVVLEGIPQVVYRIPISMPSASTYDPDGLFLERIILGPCNEEKTVRAGLVALLAKHGFDQADVLVRLSGIPYRQRM